jgi:hypothetical protein
LNREPCGSLTPEKSFERKWAMTLLEAVVQGIQGEYEGAGKGALFMALRFTIVDEESNVPYAEVSKKLNLPEPAGSGFTCCWSGTGSHPEGWANDIKTHLYGPSAYECPRSDRIRARRG